MPPPRLLVVHHSPAPSLEAMLEAVLDGTGADGIQGVEVVVRPALEAGVDDVLAAAAYVLGTPANLGYMSGALKHFFDTVYEPCLDHTTGRPYGLYLHGRTDTEGARLGVEKITTGLGWRLAQPVVSSLGPVDDAARDRCWELGAAMAAGLTLT
ncbi:MAG: flavodoxin family protein [Acidimicrobiales bacterium]